MSTVFKKIALITDEIASGITCSSLNSFGSTGMLSPPGMQYIMTCDSPSFTAGEHDPHSKQIVDCLSSSSPSPANKEQVEFNKKPQPLIPTFTMTLQLHVTYLEWTKLDLGLN